MLCDNCKKNDAIVRYTEIVNGNKREMMLCEECSRKLGIDNINLNLPIDFSSFFGDLISEYEQSDFMPIFNTNNELKCNTCNLSYKEFLNTGKLGCADCYDAFADRINTVLKRIQGSTEYLGRKSEIRNTKKVKIEEKPEKEITSKEEKISNLQIKLKDAIREERYEDAAKLRDEIKKIEEEK